MNIFIAHLFHESNTFAAGFTEKERYATGAYCRGETVRETYAGTRHYIGGMIDRAALEQAQLTFSISVGTAGPTISRACLDYYVDQILEDLRPCAAGLDGICLALHGAGVAQDAPDMETYILKAIRGVVGQDMPITASLDLHTNLSSGMIQQCDGLFSLKTYPHVDTYEAGYGAMNCLIQIIKTGKKPVMTALRLPLFAAFSSMRTDAPGPGLEIRELVQSLSKRDDVIDAAFLHGFSYADIPDSAMCALVVADGPREELCREIAEFAWERREHMLAPITTVEEALDEAEGKIKQDGLVVVVEGSDNGGGGGPNDGTFLLREMLRRNPKKAIFVSICDPEVAAECYELGVGGLFSGLLGGKDDNFHGEPIEVKEARILGISTGHFRYTTPMYFGQPYCVGKTVRLQIGNVEVVVNSVPRQTHDDRMIAITGSDISMYELICIKSELAYRAFYTRLPQFTCAINCEPQGCCSPDLSLFTYHNVSRPIYPLDKIDKPVFLPL